MERDYRLNPDIGRWRVALTQVAGALRTPNIEVFRAIEDEVEVALQENQDASPPYSADRVKYVFVLSVLLDVVAAGGRVQVVDSEIYVSWPDWGTSTGRESARSALMKLRERRQFRTEELERLRNLFALGLSNHEVREFLSSGTFWLEPAQADHPSGVQYSKGFVAALQLWSMPYRGRTGRMRRFVVVGRHPDLAPVPVIVGLIEMADDTPYNSERDRLLSLDMSGFSQWLSSHSGPDAAANQLASRFRRLRSALQATPDILNASSAEAIVAEEDVLLKKAAGRSQSEGDYVLKKRLAYAVRLAHGELALGRWRESIENGSPSLREGLRALRDLCVPRTTMEVSVCGAVPPFSAALGGKLVVSFLAHPLVIGSSQRSLGTIVGQVFSLDRVQDLLPDWGLLGITTKGLYPGHSALYNRAEVPGSMSPVRLAKVGETKGVTTTFLQPRTAKLAQKVLDVLSTERQVSLRYGTGGAKRHRRIESAILSSGLPGTFVYAGIRRPVYGLLFAGNPAGVVWGQEEPDWRIDRTINHADYSDRALSLWRRRWLPVAERRLLMESGQRDVITQLSSVKVGPY